MRNTCKLFFIFKVFLQNKSLQFLILIYCLFPYLTFLPSFLPSFFHSFIPLSLPALLPFFLFMLESRIHSLPISVWLMRMLERKEKPWAFESYIYYLLKLASLFFLNIIVNPFTLVIFLLVCCDKDQTHPSQKKK